MTKTEREKRDRKKLRVRVRNNVYSGQFLSLHPTEVEDLLDTIDDLERQLAGAKSALRMTGQHFLAIEKETRP